MSQLIHNNDRHESTGKSLGRARPSEQNKGNNMNAKFE